jgi:hypothetical protein
MSHLDLWFAWHRKTIGQTALLEAILHGYASGTWPHRTPEADAVKIVYHAIAAVGKSTVNVRCFDSRGTQEKKGKDPISKFNGAARTTSMQSVLRGERPSTE